VRNLPRLVGTSLSVSGFALLIGGLAASPASAQSAFCPTSVSGQTGIAFDINECTNHTVGAYSNAALASQSLSDLSQSSTQDATKATMASVSDRRNTEEERCPDGYSRVGGQCRPATASRFAPEQMEGAAALPPEILAFASPRQAFGVPQSEPDARVAVWSQAYGDFERRTGRGNGIGEFAVLALDAKSLSHSAGVLGGIDLTFRSLAADRDGLIVGLLTGYVWSSLDVTTNSRSSDPNVPNGFSSLRARLSGPALGVYASYFNGGFSADVAVKAEFLDFDISFNDVLGFAAVPFAGFPPTTAAFSGSGSTSVNNYTTSANLNYRIPVSARTWIEPTVGIQYTRSDYASDAGMFGLADGSLVRLQGGARLGIDNAFDSVRTTMVLTGLVYDNVKVTGGAVQTGGNPLILNDEGKLRAQGILALNFHPRAGVSSFMQVDVQGGEDFFGAGAKTGVRIAW
jgi:hypothetical protein